MNDSTAALEPRPKSSSPISGSVDALEADHRADERVEGDEQAELSGVLAQPEPYRALANVSGLARDGRRCGWRRRSPPARRRGRDVLEERGDELVLVEPQQRVVTPLEADARGGVRRQPAAADGARVVRGVEQEWSGSVSSLSLQRAVERPRHVLGRAVAAGVQVGPARVADQQRVAGQHEPRLVAAHVVGDQVRMVGGRVAGRRERRDSVLPSSTTSPSASGDVVEVDARALRQVRRRAGPLDELRQARRRGRPARASRRRRRSGCPARPRARCSRRRDRRADRRPRTCDFDLQPRR